MDLESIMSIPGGNSTTRFNYYNDAINKGSGDLQLNDPAYQKWMENAELFRDPERGGETPVWEGANHWQNYFKTLPQNIQQDYRKTQSDVEQQDNRSFKGRFGTAAKIAAMSVPAIGAGLAFGGLGALGEGAAGAGSVGGSSGGMFGSLESLGTLGGAEGAAAAAGGAGVGADGLSGVYGYSQLPYRPFDILGQGQSMGGFASPSITSAEYLAPTAGTAGNMAGGGSSGITDYFKELLNTAKEKPLQTAFDTLGSISSIGDLWSAQQQNSDLGQLSSNLMSMYGDDSPYARKLRKDLQRRDAAAGRRSQYGPRSVELQAKLAELNSGNARTLSGIYQQQGINRNNMVNAGLNLGKKTGLLSWLDNILKAPKAGLAGG